jgi:hypothetical protein
MAIENDKNTILILIKFFGYMQPTKKKVKFYSNYFLYLINQKIININGIDFWQKNLYLVRKKMKFSHGICF